MSNLSLGIQKTQNVPLTDLESIKLPYVIKDKVLISPGVWNDMYYSPEAIKNAYSITNFTDKEIASLFLDHKDTQVTEWVGSVSDVRLVGDIVIGNLNIVDKPTAMKLAYGAKFGISPKVKGMTNEQNDTLTQFLFQNFSVVISPAVKTAYINNSQKLVPEELEAITAMEEKRKNIGMSANDFYAIPMDPPSASKLPIFDKAHVQNALARFNQITGVSKEDKVKALRKIKTAAKKFGIEVSKEMSDSMMSYDEFKKMYIIDHLDAKEDEIKSAYDTMMKDEGEIPDKDMSKKDMPDSECKKEEVMKMSENEIKEIKTLLNEIKTLQLNTGAKPEVPVSIVAEPIPTPVVQVSPQEKVVVPVQPPIDLSRFETRFNDISTRLENLDKKMSEPKRVIQEIPTQSQPTAPVSSGNVDIDMLAYMKYKIGC